MTECTKAFDWKPANAQDATDWRGDGQCELHLGWILASEFASEAVVREIIESNIFKSYYTFRDSLWVNPNLTEFTFVWLDDYSKNWPSDQAFQYWQRRYHEGWSPENLDSRKPLELIKQLTGFQNEILEDSLSAEVAAREVVRIAKYFAQQMWHDLTKQGDTYLTYVEDSYAGSTLRPSFPLTELDAGDYVLDGLSDGYFTSWISHGKEVDYQYGMDTVQNYTDQDGIREDGDEIDDSSLCKALVTGSNLGDLEITGDIQRYFEASNLFGELDFDYPVTIESEPTWEGPRFRELEEAQQRNLINNILVTMDHSLLGRPQGLSTHLLICIAFHENTTAKVLDLLAKCSVPSVLVALENRQKH